MLAELRSLCLSGNKQGPAGLVGFLQVFGVVIAQVFQNNGPGQQLEETVDDLLLQIISSKQTGITLLVDVSQADVITTGARA
jgi:hypothetical protein